MSWWKQEQQDCIEEDLEVNSESSVSIVGSSNEATSVKGHLESRMVSFSWELFYSLVIQLSQECTHKLVTSVQSCTTRLFPNIRKKSCSIHSGD